MTAFFVLFGFAVIHVTKSCGKADQTSHDGDEKIGAVAYYLLEHMGLV